MDAIDTKAFEGRLLTMKSELEANIKRLEEELDNITFEDEIDDMEDLASLQSDDMHHASLLKQQRHELEEVDHALAKIKNGTYGSCEKSGRPIGLERLRAEPHTRYCLEHARAEE